MAFDISNKPYSDAAIIRSVYDLADNALAVKMVSGAANAVPVTQVQMLDDGNQTVFLRNYIYDATGQFDSYEDTDLDGAAYVLVGNAVPIQEAILAELQDLTITGPVFRDFHDYASVNVTTAAYTELIASTSTDVSEMEIFDSSGQLLVLALGAAAAEVDTLYIMPGGNGTVKISIPSGTRLSIKAVSANATAGYLAINFNH